MTKVKLDLVGNIQKIVEVESVADAKYKLHISGWLEGKDTDTKENVHVNFTNLVAITEIVEKKEKKEKEKNSENTEV